MYGNGYLAATSIEDANVVAETFRSPKGSFNKSLLEKVKKIHNGNFVGSMLKKNTYIVRGGLIGGVCFAMLAVIRKRGIVGHSIIGIVVGSLVGGVIGNVAINNKQKNKDGKQQQEAVE